MDVINSSILQQDIRLHLNYGPGVSGPSIDDIRREAVERHRRGNWRERLLYVFLYKWAKPDDWLPLLTTGGCKVGSNLRYGRHVEVRLVWA